MSIVLTKPRGYGHSRYELRTSRKVRVCDNYPSGVINKGDRYLVVTEFPGGESGYASSAGHPVRMNVCEECFNRWVLEAIANLEADQTTEGPR